MNCLKSVLEWQRLDTSQDDTASQNNGFCLKCLDSIETLRRELSDLHKASKRSWMPFSFCRSPLAFWLPLHESTPAPLSSPSRFQSILYWAPDKNGGISILMGERRELGPIIRCAVPLLTHLHARLSSQQELIPRISSGVKGYAKTSSAQKPRRPACHCYLPYAYQPRLLDARLPPRPMPGTPPMPGMPPIPCACLIIC